MLWYVAIIAGLNIGLGYVWAANFRPCPRCARRRSADAADWELESRPEQIEPKPPAPAVAETLNHDAEAPVATVDEELVAGRPDADAGQDVPAADDLIGAPKAPSLPPAMPLDPKTGLLTRAHVEWLLEQMSSGGAMKGPVTIGLMEIAIPDLLGGEPSEDIDERLLCGVSNIVRQTLGDEQTAARYTNQQILLLVPDEGVEQAMRRAEEIRQRVSTTEFTADGRTFQATLTCALTEMTDGYTRPKLFEFLREALDEAKRYGGNRTFMHDGNSPTPVVPPELEIDSQQLAI
jgi:GGDEF domain-containing protein